MKNINLTTAVLKAVQTYEKSGTPFSAYDITSSIRDSVNNQEFDISELPARSQGACCATREIPHDGVKAIVEVLHQENLFGATRAHNGQYWVYMPAPIVNQSGPTLGPPPQYSNSSAGCCVVSSPVKATTQSISGSVSPADILSYISRKLAKGQRPTLKNVQSRFKGKVLPQAQIAQVLAGSKYSVKADNRIS